MAANPRARRSMWSGVLFFGMVAFGLGAVVLPTTDGPQRLASSLVNEGDLSIQQPNLQSGDLNVLESVALGEQVTPEGASDAEATLEIDAILDDQASAEGDAADDDPSDDDESTTDTEDETDDASPAEDGTDDASAAEDGDGGADGAKPDEDTETGDETEAGDTENTTATIGEGSGDGDGEPPSQTAPPSGSPNTGTAGSGGPILYSYATDGGTTGPFLSDRDCGWSTPVSGTNSSGQQVQRTIWGFCDSVAYTPASGSLWNPAGVPSNSYAISLPGTDPSLDPITSPATSDHLGNPVLLVSMLTNLDDFCPGNDLPYPREWIRGMVTLPDNEPATETVAVFYQNFCIDFRDNVGFGSGGVSIVRWNANNPDGTLEREELNDSWFLPGLLTDERSGQAYRSYTYGSGPLVATVDGTTFVYSYMCGAGGDCTVARAPVSGNQSGSANARALADTANWSYRADDGSWVSFPAPGPFGTCAPTALSNCDGSPAAMVVADANQSDLLTNPAAEPSIKKVGNHWYLLYSAGLDDGRWAYRTATNPDGPFSAPRAVPLPTGRCQIDCRAPFWQPEADRYGRWAISYYDEHGLDGLVDLNRDRGGRLTMAYVDPLPPLN